MSPHEHKSKPRLDELYTNESRSKIVFGRTRMNRFWNLRELATAMMFWSKSEPEALPGSRHNDVIKRDQESMTITTFFLRSELFSCSPRNRSQTGFFRFNLPAGPGFSVPTRDCLDWGNFRLPSIWFDGSRWHKSSAQGPSQTCLSP